MRDAASALFACAAKAANSPFALLKDGAKAALFKAANGCVERAL